MILSCWEVFLLIFSFKIEEPRIPRPPIRTHFCLANKQLSTSADDVSKVDRTSQLDVLYTLIKKRHLIGKKSVKM